MLGILWEQIKTLANFMSNMSDSHVSDGVVRLGDNVIQLGYYPEHLYHNSRLVIDNDGRMFHQDMETGEPNSSLITPQSMALEGNMYHFFSTEPVEGFLSSAAKEFVKCYNLITRLYPTHYPNPLPTIVVVTGISVHMTNLGWAIYLHTSDGKPFSVHGKHMQLLVYHLFTAILKSQEVEKDNTVS